MLVSVGMDSVRRKKLKSPVKPDELQTVGKDLDTVETDRVIRTDPTENRRRRTIILTRRGTDTWGFTLQTYGIHHKKRNELELMTYVDYVEYNGAAYLAGMRPGDVILSINGVSMEDAEHDDLVNFIKTKCGKTMRMVVLFEDCCRKVELHMRYMKLKRVLADKIFELRSLQTQEKRIMKGLCPLQGKSLDRSINSPKKNTLEIPDNTENSGLENERENTVSVDVVVHAPVQTTDMEESEKISIETENTMAGEQSIKITIDQCETQSGTQTEGACSNDSAISLCSTELKETGYNSAPTSTQCTPERKSILRHAKSESKCLEERDKKDSGIDFDTSYESSASNFSLSDLPGCQDITINEEEELTYL